MKNDLTKYIEKAVASELCREDLDKLSYRDLKRIQMSGMWKGVEMAEDSGMIVRKLPIGEAWRAVKRFVEKPEALKSYCEISEEG